MSGALVLVGFMGAGKTTAARLLSQRPIDTDVLLEQRFGRSIAEVFDTEGEAAFRAAEEEVVLATLDTAGIDDVVALGGGAVTSARVREALAAHTVVLCEVSEGTAWRRASRKGRPLARDRATFAARYAQRAGLYETLADAFLPEGTDVGVAAGALRVLQREAPAGVRMAWARSASGAYPAFAGPGALAVTVPGAGRRFCVTDETVAELYAGRLADLSGLVEIPPGEQHKTLATAERVWRALAAQGVTRADTLVALGGGVVGDLAGFCAACYQRGIAVVQAPTTLVAQVDSAYGGKTGVDLPEAKNYVGAYHQPAAVLADTSTLESLPAQELAAGYAEVLKTALIAGGPLWEQVAAGGPVDDDVIFACARTKLAVVAGDERDDGRRQVLNLGHTVGHALETVTGYARLRHGEAVGLGLLAALRLSGLDDLRDQVRELLAAAGLPTAIDGIDPDEVVRATRADKKRVGEGEAPFVLVRAPGDVVHGQSVRAADIRAAVAELGAA